MFDVVAQKEYGGKYRSAPCKLSLANRGETLQANRLYVNDEVEKIRCDKKKRWSIKETEVAPISKQRASRGTRFRICVAGKKPGEAESFFSWLVTKTVSIRLHAWPLPA